MMQFTDDQFGRTDDQFGRTAAFHSKPAMQDQPSPSLSVKLVNKYFRVGQNQNRMNTPCDYYAIYLMISLPETPVTQCVYIYMDYTWVGDFPAKNAGYTTCIHIYGFGQPYEYRPCTRITIVFPHFGVVGTVNSNGTESYVTCCCCSKALVCMSIALWHFFPRGLCKLIRPSLHFCSKVDVNCTCRC